MKKDVIIVGGGIGGLCSGIYLLHKGFNVTIVEQKEKLGGKINIIEEEGFKFDLSASILMTPKIYTDVFEDVGKNYKDYFEIINLDPLYKVFSYDKKSLLVYGDNNKIINEFEKFEKSDPQIASWYELAQLRFTTSKNFVQKITVRFKLNWMQAV